MYQMYLTTQLLGIHHGTGKHRVDLDPAENSKALMVNIPPLTQRICARSNTGQWWFACEIFYIISTTVLKFSVGVFLLRIAIDVKHIWILRIFLVATAVFGTSYLFLVVFQCAPVASFWEIGPRAEGHCLPIEYIMIFTYTASCLNCIADWTFGILPAFIVWGLVMSLKNKILVGILLSFAAM